MMKIRVFFLLMMTLALVVSGAICTSPTPGSIPCIHFGDLPFGTTYHVGDTFHPSGHMVTGNDFQYSTGGWTSDGYAKVGNAGEAGGSGLEMFVSNINLDFNFGSDVKDLSFRFGEYGGNLNIKINGYFKNFANFADINGTTFGSVSVSVTNGLGNDKGEVKLTGGIITSFSVGGQELFIDDVCPSTRIIY